MPPLPSHPPLASLAEPSPPSQPPLLSTDHSTNLDDAPIDEGGEDAMSLADDGGVFAGAAGGGALLLLLAAASGVLYRRRVLRGRAAATLRVGAARPPPRARRRSISLKISLGRLPGRGSLATVKKPRAPAVPPIEATIHTAMQDPLDSNASPSIADRLEGREAKEEGSTPVRKVQLRQSKEKARAEGRHLDNDYV
jgi:hypothetical protein